MPDALFKQNKPQIFDRVVIILDQARSNVVRTVNSQMVIAYWLIGREIVEEEQQGKDRAEYGKKLIKELATKLSEKYGKGFSVTNLKSFRKFYLIFSERRPCFNGLSSQLGMPSQGEHETDDVRPIGQTASAESVNAVTAKTSGFRKNLSWSHYQLLMRVRNDHARSFYEIEAERNHWSVRQLERQINSLLFERLAKSRDKEGLLQLANEGHTIQNPLDMMKDPVVLEFLDLPESHRLSETELETALITHLQDFLLELGNGFAFVARQQRITLDGDHFYPDLTFYHIKLKCYVIIDLKTRKLTHGDLGQMVMYKNYYDREICDAGDNPTVGLVLCTDQNEAMVEYVLDEQNQRIFTSRYQLYLPTEEELRCELIHELEVCEAYGRYYTENPKQASTPALAQACTKEAAL